MGSLKITFSDEVESRLDQLALELNNRQAVFLAALASYRLDVKALEKPKPKKRAPKREPQLGEGNRPKNEAEVLAFFKKRGVPNPESKATQFFGYYETNGWVQGRGKKIVCWGAALTAWIKNNPDWAPKAPVADEAVDYEEFIKWVKDERPSWWKLFRDTQSIEEIDDYYIDEYRANCEK